MYRPPENSNRVKSIKSKFENIEKQQQRNIIITTTKTSNNNHPVPLRQSLTTDHQLLTRQLSDPSKRNIKRTPAFRVEKNGGPGTGGGIRDAHGSNQTLFENKVKQFSDCIKNPSPPQEVVCSAASICDGTLKENQSFLHSNNNENSMLKRPMLIKSKSAFDFNYQPINKRQNIKEASAVENIEDVLKNIDLSLLYTEPIPRSLRNKPIRNESPVVKPKIEKDIYNKSTLQLTDVDKKEFLESLKKVLKHDVPPPPSPGRGCLSDSLKIALNRPLPKGPAPKKPPRTFVHDVVCAKNSQTTTTLRKTNGKQKTDPKYMLNKLEMALRSNKLKTRKQQKIDISTTSGEEEDSDDSLLFRSKSRRTLPKIPSSASSKLSGSDLNCFNNCAKNPSYETIKKPNFKFFVSNKDPIYAEPVHINNNERNGHNTWQTNRNSLYYMSTALISETPKDVKCSSSTKTTNNNNNGICVTLNQSNIDVKMDNSKVDSGGHNPILHRQFSAEDSSLSSFTSDADSNNPSPTENAVQAKIRSLIDNFESNKQTSSSPTPSKHVETAAPDKDNRVELLKNSLKETLDRSFNNNTTTTTTSTDGGQWNNNCLKESSSSSCSDVEGGKVARMVKRFHTFQKTAPKYQQPKVNNDTLFYCCLVIERVHDCAQIKFKFPPNVETPRDIERLCFPESPDSPPLEGTSAAQTYSLLVTSETGDRTYGYCRRVLPEGSTYCLPLAYCILSKYRAPRFYKKILLELECRHGIQDKFRDKLISQFYYKKFPQPGESITINLSCIEDTKAVQSFNSCGPEDSLDLTSYIQVNKMGEYASLSNNGRKTNIFVDLKEGCLNPSFVSYEGAKTELVLTLHPDSRYEDADLKILHKLPSDILLKIFSSLLLERKVILISSMMSELSSCVDSLQSILYPFTWYHTFIPILPESLWDIVESPTPVVCGVLSMEATENRRIENGIVVNLETKSVLVEEGDEMKILSVSLQKDWRQFIDLANNNRSREYVYSVYLADAYLYVFICCFKNYKQFIVDKQFLKDELVKNAKTKGIRRFLKMFTETCMFHYFMDTALNNPESLSNFDKKIELYGSDESRIILDKLIDWHR
ncbi:hypothetical protein ABEB36_011548 [Hypothenemus hampei]|uniref:UDENN domain-containing protein n=1 Tax=Hypothenemus hampei TaxID=57062 RepID=A0ABD1E887_HYPHA